MKNNRKGFTLAELLIVVAIIAVLVAIAIPVFNGSLTKAKEATDVANLRAKYAEEQVKILTDNETVANAVSAMKGVTLNYSKNLSDASDGKGVVYTATVLDGTNGKTYEFSFKEMEIK